MSDTIQPKQTEKKMHDIVGTLGTLNLNCANCVKCAMQKFALRKVRNLRNLTILMSKNKESAGALSLRDIPIWGIAIWGIAIWGIAIWGDYSTVRTRRTERPLSRKCSSSGPTMEGLNVKS